MKLFIILSALVVMTIAEDFVIFSPTMIKEISDCFVDRAPCHSLIQSYKKNMAEVVFTACHRCNDLQKKFLNRYLMALKEYYPQYYGDFQEKYDPDHIYLPILEIAVYGN